MKLKCGNIKEGNKYWLDEEARSCVFCKEERERDSMKHFVEKCVYIKDWLLKLGRSKGKEGKDKKSVERWFREREDKCVNYIRYRKRQIEKERKMEIFYSQTNVRLWHIKLWSV